MWFHDSPPPLSSGQSIYLNRILNRTVPGEFLEINQSMLLEYLHTWISTPTIYPNEKDGDLLP